MLSLSKHESEGWRREDAIRAGLRGSGVERAALLVLPVLLSRRPWRCVTRAGRSGTGTSSTRRISTFRLLHVARLTPPGHTYYPGVPVQLIGGIVPLAHPLASGDALAARVLDDPKRTSA